MCVEIGRDEFFMGLNLIRWWYLRQARGDVLEVGCGTGRNFTHYDYDKINKVVAIDSVPDMVAQALKKVSNPRKTSLYVMNAHTIQFPSQTFDTVVDTFGLCSYEDPVAVIKEMARVCKPEGTLIFIEHGKGTYTWINNILDKGAQQHAHNWGCIWNRDIEALVKEAGLQVTGVTRWHFGTTYIIQAKPGVTA